MGSYEPKEFSNFGYDTYTYAYIFWTHIFFSTRLLLFNKISVGKIEKFMGVIGFQLS